MLDYESGTLFFDGMLEVNQKGINSFSSREPQKDIDVHYLISIIFQSNNENKKKEQQHKFYILNKQ